MTDESHATLDRVRQAISGDWTRAEIINGALGSDILAATSVRRRTIHLRDMPGADPNETRVNTYVNTHDVIAYLVEALP